MKRMLRAAFPLFLLAFAVSGGAVVPTPQAGQTSQADYLDYYLRAAKYALNKGNLKDTSNFIRLGLQIDPQNESLLALRKSLLAKPSAASSVKISKDAFRALSTRQDALDSEIASLRDAHHGLQGRLEGLAARQEDLHQEVEALSAKIEAQNNALKRILAALGIALAAFLFFFLVARFLRKRKRRLQSSRTLPGDADFRPVTFERAPAKDPAPREEDRA